MLPKTIVDKDVKLDENLQKVTLMQTNVNELETAVQDIDDRGDNTEKAGLPSVATHIATLNTGLASHFTDQPRHERPGGRRRRRYSADVHRIRRRHPASTQCGDDAVRGLSPSQQKGKRRCHCAIRRLVPTQLMAQERQVPTHIQRARLNIA